MALSSLTAVPEIAENSQATPGLWNNIYSIISRNVSQINTDASIASVFLRSGSTLTTNPVSLSLVASSYDSGGAVFNVRAFGATGDGVTDDRASIQTAINAAALSSSSSGAVVYFPAGRYACSVATSYNFGGLGLGTRPYALSIPVTSGNSNPNITFQGAGRNSSVLQKISGSRTSDYNLFLVQAVTGQSASWVAFQDLGFDGIQTAGATPFTTADEHFIYAAKTIGLNVSRCKFYGARGGGIYAWQSYFNNIQDSHFELLNYNVVSPNNSITLIGGVTFFDSRKLGGHIVAGNTFYNNIGGQHLGLGGYSGSGDLVDVTVANNIFVNDPASTLSGGGIELVSNGNADLLKRVTINGCVFENSAIGLQGTNVLISGCAFSNCTGALFKGTAIYANNGAQTDQVMIMGCSVDSCASTGFYLDGTNVRVLGCSIASSPTGIRIISTASGTHVAYSTFTRDTSTIVNAGTNTVLNCNVPMPVLQVDIGSATTPAMTFASEASLGWFRSGVSTMALSYGTLNVNQARLVSVRTQASSGVTNAPSASAGELWVTVGASGLSVGINSGGSLYWINSTVSSA